MRSPALCAAQAVTRKTRILDVVYNASNNELVRTQTLVKNAIIQVRCAEPAGAAGGSRESCWGCRAC